VGFVTMQAVSIDQDKIPIVRGAFDLRGEDFRRVFTAFTPDDVDASTIDTLHQTGTPR
jgi:hypothetical protein